ncbi:family 16 glycoside hydrolase [Jiulongibacter sediminis]|uniref:family 16 glycoside hydrolase n=1 Tax=Jiulongibacter sediminis TaxID=1605367 RepID=UPI0026ED8043|nr:family 16 glycoside hydrolase [Jiulongibacter sediminis]
MNKAISLLTLCLSLNGLAQNLEMKAENFDIPKPDNVEFLTYKGMKSMKLSAGSGPVEIRNFNFKDGTLEFDQEATTPGFAFSLYFHRKDDLEQEIVYLRLKDFEDPLSNETIQYTTYLDGVNLWDMHPHYQAPAPVKLKDWNHLKLVISGKRMKVYCNGKEVLDIPELEGRTNDGKIAFEGNSYVTNVSVKPNETEGLHPEALPDLTKYQSNYIREWTITEPQNLPKGKEVTRDDLPTGENFAQTISAERLGLINFTREHGMSKERRVIWLKAEVESKVAQTIDLQLGFSDEIWLFLNNQMTYVDKNLYLQDMQKYPKGRLSIENGSVPLHLKEGKNTITVALANDFYGWGLMARLRETDNLLSIEKYTPPPVVAIEDINQYLGTYATQAFPVTIVAFP